MKRYFKYNTIQSACVVVAMFFASCLTAQNNTMVSDTSFYNVALKQIFEIKIKEGTLLTQKSFHRNGAMQALRYYDNEISIGEHQFWYEDGTPKQFTSYINGQTIKDKTWFENGVLHKEQNYLYEKNMTMPTKNKPYANKYNRLLHGEFIENYKSGQHKTTGFYDSGVRTKTWIDFFENGAKQFEGEYKYGINNGSVKHWYANGKLKDVSNYKIVANNNLSIKNSRNNSFSENKRWKSFRHGKYIAYYENGKMSIFSDYKNGKTEGDYKTWGLNGNLNTWNQYKNGLQYGKNNSYYSDGKPAQLSNEYYDEKNERYFDGKYLSYYKNGNIRLSANYKNKKLEGPYLLYHENGNPQAIATYKNGQFIGKYVTYKVDGQIETSVNYVFNDNQVSVMDGEYYQNNNSQRIVKGNYIKGKKEGVWRNWYGTQLMGEETFCDGKLCGVQKKWNTQGELIEEMYYSEINNNLAKRIKYQNNKIAAIYYNNEVGQEYKTLNYENGELVYLKYFLGNGYQTYQNKKLIRALSFFSNGNLKLDKHLLDNNTIGSVFNYYFDGQPMMVENYSEDYDYENNFYVIWDPSGKLIECKTRDEKQKTISKETEIKLYQLALKNSIKGSLYKQDSGLQNFNTLVTIETKQNEILYKIEYLDGKPCLIYGLKNNLSHGNFEYRSNNGTKLIQGQCLNGIKDGLWTTKNNDNIRLSEITYTKDTSYTKFFYSNQQVYQQFAQKGYNYFGEFKSFYENGQMQTMSNYERNSLNGPSNEWFMNGNISKKQNYVDGVIIGNYLENWENGKLKSKGFYKKNKKDNIWYEYNDKGTLLGLINYDNKRESIFINNICSNPFESRNVNLPKDLTPATQYQDLSLIQQYRKYIYNNDMNRSVLGFKDVVQDNATNPSKMSFTAYYNDRHTISNSSYNFYGYTYNAYYNPNNPNIAIDFQLTRNNNKTELKAKLNAISYIFSKNLIFPSETKANYLLNSYFSELKFKISGMRVSNDSIILENPSNFCFIKSNIVGTKINFNIDSVVVQQQKDYPNFLKPTDSLNSFGYLEQYMTTKHNRYSKENIFESKNTTFFFPENLLDSTQNNETELETKGHIILSETKLFGLLKFKAEPLSNSQYAIDINNKKYIIPIDVLLKRLRHTLYSSQIQYKYLPKTKELLIYISK